MAYETNFVAGPNDLGGSYLGDRWSYNLARPPGWLAGNDPSIINWYHDNVFDRQDIDPNDTLANFESSMRSQANRLGVRLPDDSGGVLILYAQLQLNQTSWAHIQGTDGSAPTASGGPTLLDQIAVAQEAAIAPLRNAEIASGQYLGDDVRLVAQANVGNDALSARLAGGAPAPVYAPAPTPARDEASMMGYAQTGGAQGNAGFNTQSAFNGFGTSGSLAGIGSGIGPAQIAASGKGLIVLAVLGAAYVLLRKHLK